MNDTKTIGSISVVTDSEVSYSNIGDVEAGFDETMLRQHIEKHGPAGLYEAISYLSFQVFEAVRELNAKKEKDVDAKFKFLTESILPIKVKHDKPSKTDGRLSHISLLEDLFDRPEYLAKMDADIQKAKELLFPKKENKQEVKTTTSEGDLRKAAHCLPDTMFGEVLAQELKRGDKFKVVDDIQEHQGVIIYQSTTITVEAIDNDFITTWRKLGTIATPLLFNKTRFAYLLARDKIRLVESDSYYKEIALLKSKAEEMEREFSFKEGDKFVSQYDVTIEGVHLKKNDIINIDSIACVTCLNVVEEKIITDIQATLITDNRQKEIKFKTHERFIKNLFASKIIKRFEEAKQPTWEEAVAVEKANQIIRLHNGYKFEVVTNFQVDTGLSALPGYDIEIFNIHDNSIDVWITSTNNSFYPHTFNKSRFQYLIASGTIKHAFPPPPVNIPK